MTRRVLIFVLFVLLLATLYVLSRQYMSINTIVEREAELRDWLAQHPWKGFGFGFLIYCAISLVPGMLGKAIVFGWFYGFWAGLVIVNVGLTAVAITCFCVSRYVCHDFITRRYGERLARVNVAIERDGANYLFAARVLHVPYTPTNYVTGVTDLRLRDFWWATQLGLLPGNVLFVYAGAQAPTLEELLEEGISSLLTPGLIVAFVAMSIGPLFLRNIVRRLLIRLRK